LYGHDRVLFTLHSIVLSLLRFGDSKSFFLIGRDVFANDDRSKSHVAPFSLPAAGRTGDRLPWWPFGIWVMALQASVSWLLSPNSWSPGRGGWTRTSGHLLRRYVTQFIRGVLRLYTVTHVAWLTEDRVFGTSVWLRSVDMELPTELRNAGAAKSPLPIGGLSQDENDKVRNVQFCHRWCRL